MKKIILRNIAIVSAVFIAAFSVMLIVSYFQVRNATPLQTEIMETLRELNDADNSNPVLQEQIRQLDLLARRAYFTSTDHLLVGGYILLGMFIVFLLSIRLYFSKDKNTPERELSPVDVWIIQSNARRYVLWLTGGMVAVAIVFGVMSFPFMKGTGTNPAVDSTAVAVADLPEEPEQATELPKQAETTDSIPVAEIPTDSVENREPVSKVTHNAFRGNQSNGVSDAKGIPTEWNLSKGKRIAWQQPVPRKGYNSPVINGHRVFFTGADDKARELYCYDLITGEKRWMLTATGISGSPKQVPQTTDDTGLAASTVATNGKQVCAIFATGDLICGDMDGKQLWAKNLGVPQNHYGYASSLQIFGNLLVVQYDNQQSPRVIAFDIATGAERWSKSRTEKITWSSPVIAGTGGNARLILMGNPGITAYNPANGEQLWRVERLSGEVGSSACSANGIVYAASEYATLVAIDATDGKVLWEASDYLPEVSSPVATKDHLYLATSYGVVAAYDAHTGKLVKTHELNTGFYSSPMIVEGKIYLFNNEGKMHIFSTDKDFRLLSSFETGEKTFATPAFTDRRIVVRTEKSIYCVVAD